MKPARILLLVVAIVAGGLAAYLATRGDAPQQTAETKVVEAPKTMVLIANRDIGVGERLNRAALEWQDWPESALRPEYVTRSNMPDAPDTLTGTVARFEIFAGEPIRDAKLVRTDQGYLSAVLAQGMRGVSVGVAAVSGAGGFINPNDRVDVVMTDDDITRTILQNVRVLAIGTRLGETGSTGNGEDGEEGRPRTFSNATIATLELTPAQAETIISAGSVGELSLVLRSVADFSEKVEGMSTGGAVRLIRYGQEASVQSGMQSTPQPSASQSAAPSPAAPSGPSAPAIGTSGTGLPPVPTPGPGNPPENP